MLDFEFVKRRHLEKLNILFLVFQTLYLQNIVVKIAEINCQNCQMYLLREQKITLDFEFVKLRHFVSS